MSAQNRRKFDRLRIDRSVRISVQLFPVLPFLGESIDVGLVNISPGGLALSIADAAHHKELKKGHEVRVHIRLPGLAIEECTGTVTRRYSTAGGKNVVGVKFTKVSAAVSKELVRMSKDNALCDQRVASGEHAWCLPTCSFYSLCRKPLRLDDGRANEGPLELSFQRID